MAALGGAVSEKSNRGRTRRWTTVLLLLLAVPAVRPTPYLPGVAPRSYASGEPVTLYVNKLTSTHTQIPYDYYRLPFCSKTKIHEQAENIGERLAGDKIENSLYELKVGVDEHCKVVCRKRLGKSGAKAFAQAIDDDYRVHWIVDNLPVSTLLANRHDSSAAPYRVRGFPVGFALATTTAEAVSAPTTAESSTDAPQQPSFVAGLPRREHFLFNHVKIVVSLHEAPREEGVYHVVGFRVEPFSVTHSYEGEAFDAATTRLLTCNAQAPVRHDASNYLSVDHAPLEVIFTYDVEWEASPTPWSHRWDVFLATSAMSGGPDDKIHWFSITNSTMIVVFLTVMVAMILVRTLSKDIANYNQSSSAAAIEDDKEETGWKLVHADVFRPPVTSPMAFAVLIGSGAQLGGMAIFSLAFAVAGLLSPANRGSLITAMLMLFVFMGAVGGYAAARIYKTFRGLEWLKCTILVATAFPSVVFVIFLAVDVALTAVKSTGAVPLSTLAALVALWFGVSAPLVVAGAYVGFGRDVAPHPVRTNQIPRQIPPQPWYMHPVLTTLFGGVLPFGAVSVELFFVMSAIWLHQIYYIFGFLFLVVLILIATCAEMTVLLCYFQLCNEDYRWWWRAALNSGASAFYVMAYAIWYYLFELDMAHGLVPSLLYFAYMFLIALAFFLITANIGFFACYRFVTTIYASIKVD
mmetsp:Transcript_2612/g.10049  ORF Transcript_2612/g.10049 Transcript_2612/m.10049 type:complete len:691 (-) Transcript_2612:313-2385(-)